jgi:predicted RNase H-like HicB family nuclease
MTATEYLRKPYARRLTPNEHGGYVGTIQEFPGLVAEGETAEASMAALEDAARSWIEAALGSGQKIPEPVALTGYSGKVALRMPRGLHKRAAEMASSEGCSLNQWLVSAVSFYLGGHELTRMAVEVMVKNSWSFTTNNNYIRVNIESNPESLNTGLGAVSASLGSQRFGLRTTTTPALGPTVYLGHERAREITHG